MAFCAYILRCSDGRYYTGHTDDLERRIAQHQQGEFCSFTSRRRPVHLVWSENFSSRLEALEAERVVGGWSKAKKEALIAGDWLKVRFFAKPPRERFSTSLETNGAGGKPSFHDSLSTRGVAGEPSSQNPFVSSEVQKRAPAP